MPWCYILFDYYFFLINKTWQFVTTKGFVLSGQQKEAVSSGHLVGVVAKLSTLFAVGAAEALAGLELVEALAGEGGEAALWVDGVREQLVGASVVAKVVVSVVCAVVSWNSKLYIIMKYDLELFIFTILYIFALLHH